MLLVKFFILKKIFDRVETRKGFLRTNIVAVSFFSKLCCIHLYLFHYLKPFMNIFSFFFLISIKGGSVLRLMSSDTECQFHIMFQTLDIRPGKNVLVLVIRPQNITRHHRLIAKYKFIIC